MERRKQGKELSKLKGKIREEGKSYRYIAEKIGVSLSTFNNRMNGVSLFDIIEASKVAVILNIPPEDIPIFFT